MISIKEFFKDNIAEIITILGLIFIIYATFRINDIAGIYVTGFILVLLGIFLATYPVKGGDNKK